MKTSNYQEVRDALYHRERFTHGSRNGNRNDYTRRDATSTTYSVWSYNTLILTYNLNAHRVTYFDNRYYSQTTSRLQSMIRAAFLDEVGGLVARVVYEY
jgi:hypothetical protein